MALSMGLLGAASFVAPSGAYDLLATEILTGSQASVTFSSLGDYATDYQHLQLRIVARTDRAFDGDVLLMQFNSDTGSNYSYHALFGNGSTVISTANATDTVMEFFRISGGTDAANAFGGMVMDILDPFETSKYKTVRALSGVASDLDEVHLRSASWRNTDALTTIKLDKFGSNFVTGSRFSLYGLKASV